MIKLLIVDDHIAICDLFKNAFERNKDYKVIGMLNNGNLALAFCKLKHPDLILMDICADGRAGGLNAAKEIKEKFPKIKIIMMSGFDEISFIPRARELGADAFIYKSSSLDFFLETAGKVMGGERYFPEPKKIEMPIEGETPFTDKEMMVLRLLCQCRNRKEIATELCISEHTVKFHINNMLSKTGFESAAELAIFTISGGWINPRF